MTDITWTTENRRLGDLAEWERNPAEITEHDARHLQISIDKFGLALPLIANVNGDLIDGHQRKTVMLMLGKHSPDEMVDVRIPSRELSKGEREELAIRLRRNTGGWNWDTLANEFEIEDLKDWGFTDFDFQMHDVIAPMNYSDFEKQLEKLDGYEEKNITITVPEMYRERIIEWLANGEIQTAPGIGKGVMRRCGLLS